MTGRVSGCVSLGAIDGPSSPRLPGAAGELWALDRLKIEARSRGANYVFVDHFLVLASGSRGTSESAQGTAYRCELEQEPPLPPLKCESEGMFTTCSR